MKAIVQRAYGNADVLKLEEIDRPVVGDDDVLIRVRAAAVNHADLVYTTGRPLIARLAFGMRAPKDIVRGKDVAGTVEAVGSRVSSLKPGDDVYGELVSGSFAEYAVAPADRVALKPSNLTFEQAATVPLSGMTALQGLRDAGSLTAGQRVLVNGASGGVGSFAVQIAKALGADVTAVASARNAELVRSWGADHVVDYGRENFTLGTARYDVIFDLIGNHTLSELRGVLTPKGTLVLSSGTGGRVLGPMGRILAAAITSPFVSQTLSLFTQSGTSTTLDDLRHLIESGKVTPAIDRTYPLTRVAEAVRYFADEHARGKIAISV
jgi:NADPH:quinone reductase-like Zn-dependent oxidoreductase